MQLEIPEIKTLLNEISLLKQEIIKEKKEELPMWLNNEQCWKLKGGMAFNTYKSNRFYQCKGGIPDAKVGGRNVWHRDSVIEWLNIPDSELKEYHIKYKTGITSDRY